MFIEIGTVAGLRGEDQARLDDLVDIYNNHREKNEKKEKYYNGNIKLNDVNLGIALPTGLDKLEIGCAWGAKTVDVLAARSMFDGFVAEDGASVAQLEPIVRGNRLLQQYNISTRDELKFGSTFATLSHDARIGCKIRYHSPLTASARWDGEQGRIRYGMAVIDTREDNGIVYPTLLNLYTDEFVCVMRETETGWRAEYFPHIMGRPLMEPMTWNATSTRPFGRSRIKEPIRRLIDGYVRTIANATIGLEFSTAPQKYLLGVSDSQFDDITENKFKNYVGSILTTTLNPETGDKPTFGQLMQGNISPHVEMIRILATQFSAATGLPVSDTGVVNDANPTSSDAITAQTKTLVGMAEQLNTGNGDALKTIAEMALAISEKKTLDALTDEQRSIVAHFKNPALPSIAATTDAAMKIASTRQAFGQTDVFLEMTGYDQADIRRIKAQEARIRGLSVLEGLTGGNNG